MNYFPVGGVSGLKATYNGEKKKLKGFIIENVDYLNNSSMEEVAFTSCDGELYCLKDNLYKLTTVGWVIVPNSSNDGYLLATINDKIYAINSTQSCEWDGERWTNFTSLPAARTNAKVVSYNNEIYLTGGEDSNYSPVKTFYKYDGVTWTQMPNIPRNSSRHGVAVYNNKIYVVGGYTSKDYEGNYSYSSDSYYFDLQSNTWVKTVDSPYQFTKAGMTTYNGKIVLFGGRYSDSSHTYTRVSIYTFDDTTNKWTLQGKVPFSTGYSVDTIGELIVHNGRLRFFGDIVMVFINDKWLYNMRPLNSSYVYGPVSNGGNIIIPIFAEL